MKRYNGIAGIKQWALLLALWVLAVDAAAGERVALVIGNGKYQHAPFLSNPLRDAQAVAQVLKDLDFTVTEPLLDQKKGEMDAALRDFGQRAHGAEAAVVYFAGHGMEVKGENYLIPVDATLVREADASLEAVKLEVVLDQLAGVTGYGLVILDACRDNPLANQMRRADGTRAMYRGLVRVEPSGQIYVAYAAKHGALAQEGTGEHSPFTTALLKYLRNYRQEPLALERLFGAVRKDVLATTQPKQEPWLYSAPTDKPVYLVGEGPDDGKSPVEHDLIPKVIAVFNENFKWVLAITGLVALLTTMSFALMYRHVRVANQGLFNSRVLSRMIRERISRSYYNLSHRHTLRRKEQAIQPKPQPQPQLPPTPKTFYRLVPQRNDRGLPTLILPKPGNYRLGRMQADNIQLVVPSQYVSSEHLVIIVNPDYSIAVENLKPTNKTHIAGVEVSPGQICPIQPGQTLRLGHDEVIYSLQKG